MSMKKLGRKSEQGLSVPKPCVDHLRRHSWDCNAADGALKVEPPQNGRNRQTGVRFECDATSVNADKEKRPPWWNMRALKQVFVETPITDRTDKDEDTQVEEVAMAGVSPKAVSVYHDGSLTLASWQSSTRVSKGVLLEVQLVREQIS